MLHTDDDVEDDESDEELDLHRPPPRWLQQSVSSQPPPLMQPSLAADEDEMGFIQESDRPIAVEHSVLLSSSKAGAMQSLAPSERRSDSDAALEGKLGEPLSRSEISAASTQCDNNELQPQQEVIGGGSGSGSGCRPSAALESASAASTSYGAAATSKSAFRGWAVGDKLHAMDCRDLWCEASVIALRGEAAELELKVHYRGWKKKWDEWLPASCPRVRPLPADYHMKRGRTLELLQVPSAAEQREFAVASSAAAAGFRTAAHVTCAANEAAEAAKNAAAKNAELKAALARAADGDTRSLAAAAEAAEAAAAEAAAASQRAKVAQAEAAKLRIAADDNREGADDNVGGSSRCESAGYDEEEDDESGPLPSVARTFSSSTMLPSSSSAARQGRGRGRGRGRSGARGGGRGGRSRGERPWGAPSPSDAVKPEPPALDRGLSDGDRVRADWAKFNDGDYERCGVYGCILANKHSGLHIFPDEEEGGRRRRQRTQA